MSMDWAMRRRITIVVVIITFLSLITGLYVYINRPVPTCFDKKQNQNETGVDCGGLCTLQCVSTRVNFEIKWTKVFPVRENVYDIAALVEYPSGNTGVPTLRYTAKLFSVDGHVLSEKTGTTFAGPSDHFLLFFGGIETSSAAVRAEVVIDPSFSTVRTANSAIALSVLSRELSAPDVRPKLVSMIQNNSSVPLRNIPVAAIVSDENGPVAVAETYIDSLPAHSVRPAEFSWPEALKYKSTESCGVPVDVMLIVDKSGTMGDDGKLDAAKAAAVEFVGNLTPKDQVGYVSFASNASSPIDSALSGDTNAAVSAISNTVIATGTARYTNTSEALNAAQGEFISPRARVEASKAVVFLTDGEVNRPVNPNDPKDKVYPAQLAVDAATNLKNLGVTIFTIGLGQEALLYGDFLKALASSPDNYFEASSTKSLSPIYKQIGTSICKRGLSVIEIIPRVDVFGTTNVEK